MRAKKTLLLIFISIIFFSCRENPKDFLNKLSQQNRKNKSVSYKITEKTYYSNEPDTTITPFDVSIEKVTADSLIHGYVWVENKYRPYSLIYNLKKFFLVMPTKHKTRLYPTFDYPFISEVDWIDFFLNPQKLENILKDTSNVYTVRDTLFNNKTCKKLQIKFAKDKKANQKTYNFIFNKNKYFPIFAQMTYKTKNSTYFDDLYFSGITYNTVKQNVLDKKLKKLISNNPTIPYDPESTEVILENMLQIGDKAPLIKGKFYKSKEDFDLQNYIGKNIIILDFWYTHCHPCVKAMPELSKLYSEYKDKGLKVFGLNYIDNNKENIDNLNLFLSKRKLSYKIILTNSSVDNRYKIIGYPSMYVIDLKGNIAYVEVGFTPESFEKMKSKVKDLLENK